MSLVTRTFRTGSGSRAPANDGAIKPQLTSLVDVLTVMMVFLISIYSADGGLITAAEDLELPPSISRQPAPSSLNVEVATREIRVAGRRVADTAVVAASDSLLVAPLYEELRRLSVATASQDAPQPVSIQCDRRLDFRVLKRVVHTCSRAGHRDFNLVVRSEEP